MSLAEFISHLAPANSGWHEWSVEVGAELADAFTLSEWEDLALQWQSQSTRWQERCCECLGNTQAPESTPILAAMLRSAPHAAAVIAVSQLLDRGWAPTTLDVQRLKSLRTLNQRLDDIDALLGDAANDA